MAGSSCGTSRVIFLFAPIIAAIVYFLQSRRGEQAEPRC